MRPRCQWDNRQWYFFFASECFLSGTVAAAQAYGLGHNSSLQCTIGKGHAAKQNPRIPGTWNSCTWTAPLDGHNRHSQKWLRAFVYFPGMQFSPDCIYYVAQIHRMINARCVLKEPLDKMGANPKSSSVSLAGALAFRTGQSFIVCDRPRSGGHLVPTPWGCSVLRYTPLITTTTINVLTGF